MYKGCENMIMLDEIKSKLPEFEAGIKEVGESL